MTDQLFKRTLEPFMTVFQTVFGEGATSRSASYRHLREFERHLVLVQGKGLARHGRKGTIMISQEVWRYFEKSFLAFRSGKYETFDLALAEQFSGVFPTPRSLDDVYALVLKERESGIQTRAELQRQLDVMTEQHELMVGEFTRQHELTLSELRDIKQEYALVTARLGESQAMAQAQESRLRDIQEGMRLLGRYLNDLTK